VGKHEDMGPTGGKGFLAMRTQPHVFSIWAHVFSFRVLFEENSTHFLFFEIFELIDIILMHSFFI
jgi:hypothetical protein